MKARFATRVLVRLAALAMVATGFAAVDVAVNVAPAEAATACTYDASTITSTKVHNLTCPWGAYGYRASATATTGTRTGAWVGPGNWSYNGQPVCYQYPTMVKK